MLDFEKFLQLVQIYIKYLSEATKCRPTYFAILASSSAFSAS